MRPYRTKGMYIRTFSKYSSCVACLVPDLFPGNWFRCYICSDFSETIKWLIFKVLFKLTLRFWKFILPFQHQRKLLPTQPHLLEYNMKFTSDSSLALCPSFHHLLEPENPSRNELIELQSTLDISNTQGTDRKKSSRYREFEISSSYSAWIDAKGTESFVRDRAKFEIPRFEISRVDCIDKTRIEFSNICVSFKSNRTPLFERSNTINKIS